MIKFKFFLIGLCFLFLNEAKAQNEAGFDTLDFNILRRLGENETLKLRLISTGCFHYDQRRIEFHKEKGVVQASIYTDANYDIFDGESGNLPDSMINAKILNHEDLIFFDSLFKKSFEYSKLGWLCTTTDRFTLFYDKKRNLNWSISYCSQSILWAMIDKIEK